MNRVEAYDLMKANTPSESLRKHMLSVESCMKWYAGYYNEPTEPWQIAGILHDFDYELHPDEHPLWGMAQLREIGVDENIIKAIAAHYPAKTGVEPESLLERVLFACDELSGFIMACCYVRPERINGLTTKSVTKKLKTANFAAGVNRADVHRGAELLQIDLSQHIQNCIDAMTADAEILGLS